MARLAKGQDFSVYSSPNFQFWYEEKWYTAQGAETMASIGTKDDMATMRAEYTRMRDVAQKRIQRLQKDFPNTAGARIKYDTGKKDAEGNPIYKSGFQKLKNLDPRDFPKAFSELAKFIRATGSTVTGQRIIQEKTMNRLNKAIGDRDEKGNPIYPVNPSNYWRVIDQLEEARRRKVTYGSDKMVELADATLELTQEQFNVLLNNLSKALEHSEEMNDSLHAYMLKKGIQDYQKVNMDDFIKQLGW